MGIFDKAKDLVGSHAVQVDQGVDKAAELADDKTGNKYSEQIDQGADVAKDKIGEFLTEPDPDAQPDRLPDPPA